MSKGDVISPATTHDGLLTRGLNSRDSRRPELRHEGRNGACQSGKGKNNPHGYASGALSGGALTSVGETGVGVYWLIG